MITKTECRLVSLPRQCDITSHFIVIRRMVREVRVLDVVGATYEFFEFVYLVLFSPPLFPLWRCFHSTRGKRKAPRLVRCSSQCRNWWNVCPKHERDRIATAAARTVRFGPLLGIVFWRDLHASPVVYQHLWLFVVAYDTMRISWMLYVNERLTIHVSCS